jgi:predicted enzyme related to lactoylglutathione lyase
MKHEIANPIVHLELRTSDLAQACAFYRRLFGWRAETIRWRTATYVTLDLGEGIEGGIVEHEREGSGWIPYVEVADVGETVARARLLGAAVTLEPSEGPAGWRSVLVAPSGGEIALWQPKW